MRDRGFTLVEIMITLSVVGVLVALAFPAFRTLAQSQHVKSGASDFHTALLFARSEALKRAADVDVIAAGADWKNGWTVQVGATVLRKQPALDAQLDAIPASGAPKITYQNDGRVTAAPATAVFRISSNTQVIGRCVSVDLSGRPAVIPDSNGDPTDGCN